MSNNTQIQSRSIEDISGRLNQLNVSNPSSTLENFLKKIHSKEEFGTALELQGCFWDEGLTLNEMFDNFLQSKCNNLIYFKIYLFS